MKYSYLILLLISCCAFGQNSDRLVKTANQKEFINKKLSFYTEQDANGNAIFIKNDGRNGPITILSAADYDNLNRPIRDWSAHSNIGFSKRETVYDGNQVLVYEFVPESSSVYAFDRKTLQAIDSKEDFLKMDAVKNFEHAKKTHKSTNILDNRKNIIKEIYLSETGDTTAVNTYQYNAQNKNIHFHMGDRESEEWVWDIYFVYNDHGDETQSYRLQMVNGVRDTTELRNRIYNTKNQLLSENYYANKKFNSRTDYFYDQNDLLIKELFYQNDEKKRKAETTYTYNKTGKLLKKTVTDYHFSEKGTTQVFTSKDSP